MSEVGNLLFDQDAIYLDIKKKTLIKGDGEYKKFNSQESTKRQVERIIWNLQNLKNSSEVQQDVKVFSESGKNIIKERIASRNKI
jgi:hypothetical protein